MVQIFYGGLSPSSRTLVNTAVGGSFFQKIEDETHDILEELAYNNDQCPSERRIQKHDPVTPEMELMKALAAQVADLTKSFHEHKATVQAVQAPAPETCFWCAGPHSSDHYAYGDNGKQVNFVNNRPTYQNANNYHPGARNDQPNPAWRTPPNNKPMQPAPQAQPRSPPYQPPHRAQENKPNLEDIMAQLTSNTNSFMTETRTALQSQSAQIRNLEMQIGQLVSAIHTRPQGVLPSTSEVNPREHCNAILHQRVAIIESPKHEEE